MTDLGFEKAGFDESVWVRNAGGRFKNKIVVGVHIDDSMIACRDLAELEDFKRLLLERFKGTNGGEITEYLGCAVVRDWKKKSITLHQSLYSQRILQLYGIDQSRPFSTPLEPGKRLTKRDSPAIPDPRVQARFRGILGHTSFLVQMTRPDLAFSFAELSKFASCPGTVDHGITYSDPGPKRRHVLMGWVDSDFAADPDTRRSVTGYVISLNNGPVSWKAKRQGCVTLSSAEAEFVAASQCGQEVLYLRQLLEQLGYKQTEPTRVYEDNEACIKMSENPTNPGA
eukprot:735670-Rhodomonas_salina.1